MKSIRFLSLTALILVGIISCGKKGIQPGTDNCNQELINMYNSTKITVKNSLLTSNKAGAQEAINKLKSEFGGVTCYAKDELTGSTKSVNIDSETDQLQSLINFIK